MEHELLVYTSFPDGPRLAGRIWTRQRKGQESASFEYDRGWLRDPLCYALEPALMPGPGAYHTAAGRALFGAIGDSAPDRWGRILMRRAERRRAQEEHTTPRTLSEGDYLLGVDDETRQGALRFARKPGGPFLAAAGGRRIPPLIDLPKLLHAADRVSNETENAEDLRLLLAPGSSLGGARPKASVRDRHGRLSIAKFPQKSDELHVVPWEAVALTLAARAGIPVPTWRLETVAKKPVLVVERFDRDGTQRIGFLSAMSMLGAADGDTRSYLDLAGVLMRHGAAPNEDLAQLWRRIVFNILISNTDDHLRNHGFLFTGTDGWRLSPAYDLNPTPPEFKPRVLSTLIDRHDGTASLELAFSVAKEFRLKPEAARTIAAEVAIAVRTWRSTAAGFGIKASELDRVAPAFEHRDLEQASRGQLTRPAAR